MTEPEVVVRHLIERLMRTAGAMPGVPIGPGEAALDRLKRVVAAKLGDDSALPQLESVVARLRMELREAMDNDPRFAAELRAALPQAWRTPGMGNRGGFPPGGVTGPRQDGGAMGGPGRGPTDPKGPGQHGYAVEDVWVDEPEQRDPPESSGRSPRT